MDIFHPFDCCFSFFFWSSHARQMSAPKPTLLSWLSEARCTNTISNEAKSDGSSWQLISKGPLLFQPFFFFFWFLLGWVQVNHLETKCALSMSASGRTLSDMSLMEVINHGRYLKIYILSRHDHHNNTGSCGVTTPHSLS